MSILIVTKVHRLGRGERYDRGDGRCGVRGDALGLRPTPQVGGPACLGAAREVLGRVEPSVPRARGEREALRVLMTTRRAAQMARVAAINQLKALVVTAPVDLRDQIRGLITTALVAKCSTFRPTARPVDELAATPANHRLTNREASAKQNDSTALWPTSSSTATSSDPKPTGVSACDAGSTNTTATDTTPP